MRDPLWPILGFVLFFFLVCGVLVHDCNRREECVQSGGHVIPLYKGWVCVDHDGRMIGSSAEW
jgi:hypothetical protein